MTAHGLSSHIEPEIHYRPDTEPTSTLTKAGAGLENRPQ
jgi:hypothetical protein